MSSPFDGAEVQSVIRRLSLADDLMEALPLLLAADGIVFNDPSTMDFASLNETLSRAVARRNSEGFVATGENRT